MHPFQRKIFEIWRATMNALLQMQGVIIKEHKEEDGTPPKIVIDGITIQDYEKQWRVAWSMLMECAAKLENTDAKLTFGIACGNPNIPYEKIAKLLTDRREDRFQNKKRDMRVKKNVTVKMVRDLINDARQNIRKCLNKKLSHLEKPYEKE